MLNRRQFVTATGVATLGWPLVASAQEIATAKVLCGFPAGGTTDAVSRRVAEKLQAAATRKSRWSRTRPARAVGSRSKNSSAVRPTARCCC